MRKRWSAVWYWALALLLFAGSLPAAGQEVAPGGRFWDDDGNPHEANIEAIAAVGITAGCSSPPVFYCPSQAVTRGQMATFLTRAFALAPSATDFFTDDAGSIHEADINALSQAGITTGVGGGLYQPLGLVSREQMASFLARAMGLSPIAGDQFIDVSSIHEGNINAIALAGVTIGCDLNGPRYCPLDAVPREQMATFLARSRGLAPIVLPPAEVFPVLSITDGDTFRASVNGISEPVRVIGIDAPEVGSCLAAEATALMGALVAGRSVRLITDVSDRDQFGRLLRYVIVGGTFVNAEIVRQGLATAVQFPPDTFMAPVLEAAQIEAQTAGRGIWGPSGACPLPPPPPPQPPPPSGCDPSYPTVCIPPPPPDLDCADIPFRRFQVLPPDPHNFDGNHDGVGCESG